LGIAHVESEIKLLRVVGGLKRVLERSMPTGGGRAADA
jgi:hypothetical protein